jgi:hypothetical protein
MSRDQLYSLQLKSKADKTRKVEPHNGTNFLTVLFVVYYAERQVVYKIRLVLYDAREESRLQS